MRTIIANVGGSGGSGEWGSDIAESLGALLSARLAHDAPIAAARVVVEDLDGDPVDVAHRLDDEWPRFDRVIFVGTVARDRPAGTVEAYRWDGEPNGTSDPDEIAAFDSTLLTVRQLADVPEELIIVELEPDAHDSTARVSPAVAAGLERARTLVRRLATNGRAAAQLPRSPLGGLRKSPS